MNRSFIRTAGLIVLLQIISALIDAGASQTLAASTQDQPEAKQDQPEQEEPKEEQEAPAEASDETGVTIGVQFDVWAADFGFQFMTLEERTRISVNALIGADLFGRYDIPDTDYGVQLDVEVAAGYDYTAFVVGLGGVYYANDLLEEPWGVRARGSVLYGIIDEDEVPGDFDNAFGFELGAGVDLALDDRVEGLSLNLDLMARFLEFDFDEDSNVIDSDSEVGGFGARLLVGFNYKF